MTAFRIPTMKQESDLKYNIFKNNARPMNRRHKQTNNIF